MSPPTVTRLAPDPGPVTVPALLAVLGAPPVLPPFAPEALAFLGVLHRRLLTDPAAQGLPDLQALAFWLRPAALARLEDAFLAGLPTGSLAVPRGLVFHVPPANVDTLFVYSWVPSLLAGNRNLIRLSGRGRGLAAVVLLDLLGELLARPEAGSVATATALVQYAPDDAVSAAFSRAADARMLWGGDATISHLRTLPTAPAGLDLAFADRVSWAAIASGAYLALSAARRREAALALAGDLFRFDQQACSSPRLLLWCGAPDDAAAAAADLYPRLAAAAATLLPEPGPAARLERLAAWQRAALDLPVAGVHDHSGALLVLRLAVLEPADRDALTASGLGVLLEARVSELSDCLPMVTRRVQTLSHLGFSRETLTAFARSLNGRGIDRLVPLGQALAFSPLPNPVWDGIDLLRALTRLVTITAG